jgi:hypothetical protein
MTDHGLMHLMLAVIASAMLAITGVASADPDEAWLARAQVPAGIKPLLIIALDTSAAMADRIVIAAPYDPLTDYSPAPGTAWQCDGQRVYWRRGPGPAPDCTSMSGLAFGTSAARGSMQCEAARDALSRRGYFVAARAAQWRPAGYWGALRSDSADDVECRSDRGRDGRAAGPWFATNGPSGPWSTTPEGEIDWDSTPLGDPYIFYSGNYLNYLAAATRTAESTVARAVAAMLTAAIDATDELDVGLFRTSDAVPDAEGGFRHGL